MSISRWSHSRWYIYRSDDDTYSVCGDGYFLISELTNINLIIDKISNENDSSYDKKELYLYLKTIKNFNEGLISFEKFKNILQQITRLGYLRRYLKFGDLPYFFENIPLDKEVVWIQNENKIKRYKNNKVFCIKENGCYYFFYKGKKFKIRKKIKKVFKNYPILENIIYVYDLKDNFIKNDKINSIEFKEAYLKILNKEKYKLEKEINKWSE